MEFYSPLPTLLYNQQKSSGLQVITPPPPHKKKQKNMKHMKPSNLPTPPFPPFSGFQKKNKKTERPSQPVAIGFVSWLDLLHSARHLKGQQMERVTSRNPGSPSQMGVSKNNGTPKWMVEIRENPIQMDDLGGPPLFLEAISNGGGWFKWFSFEIIYDFLGSRGVVFLQGCKQMNLDTWSCSLKNGYGKSANSSNLHWTPITIPIPNHQLYYFILNVRSHIKLSTRSWNLWVLLRAFAKLMLKSF